MIDGIGVSMCSRDRTIAWLVAAMILVSVPAGAETDRPPFRVIGMRVHPYFHEVGTFGDRDLFDPTLALRNTRIGEGSLPMRSAIALVLVDVEGRFLPGRTEALELVAKTPTHEITKQQVGMDLPVMESRVQATLPFLLYDVGCERVTIQVRFRDTHPAPPVYEREIPYVCGE